jgi:sec-independent protein translocase protein TatA
MGRIGGGELLLILLIALLVFGPSRLAGLGKSLGEGLRGLRKGMGDPLEGDPKPGSPPTASAVKPVTGPTAHPADDAPADIRP